MYIYEYFQIHMCFLFLESIRFTHQQQKIPNRSSRKEFTSKLCAFRAVLEHSTGFRDCHGVSLEGGLLLERVAPDSYPVSLVHAAQKPGRVGISEWTVTMGSVHAKVKPTDLLTAALCVSHWLWPPLSSPAAAPRLRTPRRLYSVYSPSPTRAPGRGRVITHGNAELTRECHRQLRAFDFYGLLYWVIYSQRWQWHVAMCHFMISHLHIHPTRPYAIIY